VPAAAAGRQECHVAEVLPIQMPPFCPRRAESRRLRATISSSLFSCSPQPWLQPCPPEPIDPGIHRPELPEARQCGGCGAVTRSQSAFLCLPGRGAVRRLLNPPGLSLAGSARQSVLHAAQARGGEGSDSRPAYVAGICRVMPARKMEATFRSARHPCSWRLAQVKCSAAARGIAVKVVGRAEVYSSP